MKSNLKADAMPRLGVVDALSTGLVETARHPWLLVVPVVVDLWLWLAPRLSIAGLLQRFMNVWEALARSAYTPAQMAAMQDMVNMVKESAGQMGAQLNLMDVMTGGWLGVPSVLSNAQVTRMTFISDLVLMPAGLAIDLPRLAKSPLQLAPVEVGAGSLPLVALGLWLLGQVLAAVYLRWVASSWRGSDSWAGWRGLLGLIGQLILFSILVAGVILVLRLPLALALTLLMVSSSSALGIGALMLGGVALWLTLWFLSALFFVNEAILLERQSMWQGLLRSAGLVHRNFGSALALAGIVNLLMYGFRAVWGILGVNTVGSLLAIGANAYLATSMLLAIFVYYEELRKRAAAPRPRVIAKPK